MLPRMATFTRWKRSLVFILLVALSGAMPLRAQVPQADDDTVLRQIIIFGRHGVRSNAVPYSVIAPFAVRPYPDFGVPVGYLTPHGLQAQTILGGYYREYLLAEGLLGGNVRSDARASYFRANSIQRSNISAAALAAGIFPGADVPVHSFPLGTPDPIFDPIAAKVVTVDGARAAKEVVGTYGSGAALAAAYSGDLSLIRSVLLGYPPYAQPPQVPPGVVDVTTLPIPLTANTTGLSAANVINTGGLITTLLAADPFVMQYGDGRPMDQVGWGQLSLDDLSQQTRIITLAFEIQMRTPYLNELQSSNAAAHVLKSMQQVVTGDRIRGAFGTPRTKVLVINSSDAYVAGLAGLLNVHWLLPGYQRDYAAPGGALVLELRESRKTGKFFVRVHYTAQTFDQLHDLTPLSLDNPPATQQLFVPGGSKSATSLDVNFRVFERLLAKAIGIEYVEDPGTEVPPGPLTGVPLK
jgi:4-phytase / acid phosphatase